MSRIVGYTRILVDDDTSAETATLHGAGAIMVFTDTSTDWPTSTPELDACLATLSEGDTLLVTSAARLAPSATRFTRTLAGMSARGIRFRSLAERSLSTDDGPREPAEVFGALEALRVELARVRGRRRLSTDGAESRPRGRPSVVTPERLAIAVELRRHGRSLAHIAGVLGVSTSAVQRALAPIDVDRI
ncbi:recombinase family protein [Microbacterium sp.]|uniref:recombinase family protein n=1 Tax=Microbacterium sp. TaxID=51671 RepID=UPI003F70FBE4